MFIYSIKMIAVYDITILRARKIIGTKRSQIKVE
jgi:hypothetical protein